MTLSHCYGNIRPCSAHIIRMISGTYLFGASYYDGHHIDRQSTQVENTHNHKNPASKSLNNIWFNLVSTIGCAPRDG